MEEQVKEVEWSGGSEGAKRPASGDEQNLLTSSKCEVIGSFIGMGMVGFCFGIGLILAEQSGRTYREKIKWQKKISNKCNKNHNK